MECIYRQRKDVLSVHQVLDLHEQCLLMSDQGGEMLEGELAIGFRPRLGTIQPILDV